MRWSVFGTNTKTSGRDSALVRRGDRLRAVTSFRPRSILASLALAALGLASCTTRRVQDEVPSHGVGACAPIAGFECSNAVNVATLPVLAADGVVPSIAPDTELCRRYSIDLVGVAP